MAAIFISVAALAGAAHADGPPDVDSTTTLSIGGGEIELVLGDAPAAVSRDAILGWTRRAAAAVSSYYGRFPVAHVRIEVTASARGGIGGTTFRGRLIRLRLGPSVRAADLADDWTLTHEMFHLAFPDLDENHLWMEEGMATYFEPIARARMGELPPEKVWRDLVDGLPKGQPEDGDQGLDRTATWGRTYWGGAGFWLLADVQIREATGSERSARDVLRAILEAGGDGAAHWPIERLLEAGDHATGTTVLSDLYQRMAEKPEAIDLESLWKRLGVARAGRRGVRFDDDAPLAELRRAITARPETEGLR